MLEMMMSSLMSKEVLYEPLKELGDKVRVFAFFIPCSHIPFPSHPDTNNPSDAQFPPYLSENATKLSTEDKTRYESQLDRINKILKVFEDPKYSDQDKEESVKVVELMAEVRYVFLSALLPFTRVRNLGVVAFVTLRIDDFPFMLSFFVSCSDTFSRL